MAFGEIKREKEPVYRSTENKAKGKQYAVLGIVVVVVLLVVAVYLVWTSLQNGLGAYKPITTNVTENASGNETVTGCDDDCLVAIATTNVNYSVCMEVKNESKKEDCFLQLSKLSLEACVLQKDYANKKDCVTWYALNQKSPDICNNLALEDRKACIEKIDPCFYMVLTEKSFCLATKYNNYSYCAGDEACVFDFVTFSGSDAACQLLEESKVKKQVCISLAAGRDRCDELLLATQADYCRRIYATEANKPSICDVISPETSSSYECYVYFAKLQKDKSYCKKLIMDDAWNCYEEYAIAANDVAACLAIKNEAYSSKINCVLTASMQLHNASACEYMDDSGTKLLQCYPHSIGYTDDVIYPPGNCAGVKDVVWKDLCYRTLAQRTKDVAICEYVETEGVKKQCITSIKGTG